MLALILALQAGQRVQGQSSYLRLQAMKDDWQQGAQAPRDQALNLGFKLAHRAIAREPDNAAYRLMLASLHAWRERGLRLWPDQAGAETVKVIENLKASLARRPSWFEVWIMLALVKYQDQQLDQQLHAALEKAIETGRHETAVQHGIAFIGPRMMEQLAPPLRGQIIDVMRGALDNPNVRAFVVEQIVMHGLERDFRERLAADEELSALLKRYREKRSAAL
ncbi:MAG TPA: hypothetical protein VK991_10885 [Halomonas sp.]|nr:hypothetical protein [Halomonas sp.]